MISNAADANDKLRYVALTDAKALGDSPNLEIRVRADKDKKLIHFRDNGIGMSRDEVIENLGTIAKSGTREFLAHLTGDQKKDAHLIGQFGVGFYSSFIVATLSGVRRSLIEAPRQVAPLTGEFLTELLMAPRASLAALRDGALLATCYLFALRRSELVGLDYAEHGDGTGVLKIGPTSLSIQLLFGV